MAVPSPGSQIQ